MADDNFNCLPVIHEREAVVRDAEQKLLETWIEISKTLTTGEKLQVAANFIHDRVGGIAKWAIRAERHPDDPDKPGGFA